MSDIATSATRAGPRPQPRLPGQPNVLDQGSTIALRGAAPRSPGTRFTGTVHGTSSFSGGFGSLVSGMNTCENDSFATFTGHGSE